MEPHQRNALIRAIARVAQAVVGLAFVIAGTSKVVHPATFITDIWSYRLVPETWAYWIAATLPWIEIVSGAALITDRQRAGARVIAGALLVAFLAAILISWARGLDIACGCFGGAAASGGTNYPWLVTRDLLLLACLGAEPALARFFRSQAPGPVPR